MIEQDIRRVTSSPIPLANASIAARRPTCSQAAFRLRLGVICLCANLFIGPAFADHLSSMTELNEYQKKIKEAAERGDMDLADRNAVGAMQTVSKNPTAYERSVVNYSIFLTVKDLISSYRKNRKYDRANYMTNWLYSTEQKMYGTKSVEMVDPIAEFAKTLEAQNKNTEAEARYKQALAIADAAPFLDTMTKSKVMSVIMDYSQLLRKMGREGESITIMQTFKKYQ